MNLIDGLGLSKLLKKEISIKVESRISKSEKRPHLAAVLVGDNPASQVYVRNKVKSCEEVGFISTLIRKPSSISEMDLIQLIQELNSNEDIDGFIVQLPLPKHINEQKITLAIHPAKDVDGFHPENFGRMAQGMPCYLPATPMGIVEMIKHYKIQTQGKEVVVVGRSNIVGTPISILLSRKDPFGDATVTLCHSKTVNLSDFTKRADILIAAIGIPEFIKGDMVKDGVVVIDVGMNRLDGKLTGDVHFPSVAPKSSFITPVPGGVGPMTVVSLLLNTLKAAEGKIY
jgi:methylenetetrahydrofolate dehydrogenase (NADP+)/methenyltetrahydrofolate cyclohydrolase